MKLGVEGTIENESPVDLAAENQMLKTQLAEAIVVIKDQQLLINQIKQDIINGKLKAVGIPT
jgi:hypothetical protein